MDNNLPASVQLQFLRPRQLLERARAFPVVYVPFGPIEWHGLHLPLGNDTLKAHAVLVKAAEASGGVVHPQVYFHDGFDQTHMRPVLTELFSRLKKTGFRVIIGVSGHNVQGMIEMIDAALEPVIDDECAGVGLWEMSLSNSDESSTDHAAKWETSNVQFLYPDLVDIDALGTDPIVLNMSPPHGIGGLDPREHASAEVGRRNIELCAQSIGEKARELLASLPEKNRTFNVDVTCCDQWWMV